MKFVVLATATDEAAKSEAEETFRFEELRASLEDHRVTVEAQLALLGKYD